MLLSIPPSLGFSGLDFSKRQRLHNLVDSSLGESGAFVWETDELASAESQGPPRRREKLSAGVQVAIQLISNAERDIRVSEQLVSQDNI